MNIFKNKISIFIVFILCCFLAGKAWAIEYNITQITHNYNWDGQLQINNGQLVWRSSGSVDNGIFFYDGNTITNLLQSYYGYSPQIYNGKVAWYGWDGNDYEIFFYDGEKTLQLTNNRYGDTFPKIYNGRIIWQGFDGNDWEIFSYDGSQIFQITNNNFTDSEYAIDNGQIVWQGWDGHDYEIFFYDGTKTIQLTNNEFADNFPKIHNGKIVWRGYDGHDNEIFLYDGSRTIQITNNDSYDTSPEIYNGQVTWMCSDGHDYEIFFYDGSNIIQITNNGYDDGAIQIYNGQIVWQGHDGHDYEIFLYDGTKTVQLTNNNYNDISPQVNNGQIVWQGYDGNDYEIFLAKSGATLEILDGVDFSAGREVSNVPEKLISGGTPVEGAVTDGVSRSLLRMSLDKPQSVTFSLEGTGKRTEDGVLRDIAGFPPAEGNQITVNSIEVNGKNYAFVIYQAADNFVRDDFQEQDKKTSERSISIKAEFSSGSPIKNNIKLVRPPLILVHGLWSSAQMWIEPYNFADALKSKFQDLCVVLADYSLNNEQYFDTNKDVISDYIAQAKEIFKEKKISMVQADIVGHSMGGILARIYAVGDDFYYKGFYANETNFFSGSIHKLITIDTPHRGSFLAEAGVICANSTHSKLLDILLKQMDKRHMSLSKGACNDLMITSEALKNMSKLKAQILCHAIEGKYSEAYLIPETTPSGIKWSIDGLPYTEIGFGIGYTPYGILNALLDEGYGYIIIPPIQFGSDLVVDLDSQSSGLDQAYTTDYNHHHMAVTYDRVLERVTELLNASDNSGLFADTFPIN